MRVLVTGGAGFVGANLAIGLAARHADWEIVALDNLHRRGAELNLPRLREAGISFIHADVRELVDVLEVGELDALVECSAEPSAQAGVDGNPQYLVKSNLFGAYHCLELARRHSAQVIFMSTSRVYPVGALNDLALQESETRFVLEPEQSVVGASERGISEEFPLDGARTLYGATKLAAELLVEEYRAAYGVRTVINRCGVIAGPWQMGKVDQGVFTYWILAHHFGRPLEYFGYGGTGKQVRDLLHVEDLLVLVDEQLRAPSHWDGTLINVGGGLECTLSLREATALCSEITGKQIDVTRSSAERTGDVPLYISDCARLYGLTNWRPQHGPREILMAIHDWVQTHESELRQAI